ncbi:MAG: ribonuclease H family protein [Tissierellia bacterium]|nr:ribonuclease H family protein [Tissierellia bacterium]
MAKGPKFYAIRRGREAGIYTQWDEAKSQVHGYKGAEYKSFATREEAEEYLHGKVEAPAQGPEAYVDGSYDISDGSYSYGVVLLLDGRELTFSRRFPPDELSNMRNVAGEIKGAERAVTEALALGLESLTIYYDYAGIEQWALGHWKRNKKGTADYKAFMDGAREKIQLYFVKVPAHSGVRYNEMADELAKAATYSEN